MRKTRKDDLLVLTPDDTMYSSRLGIMFNDQVLTQDELSLLNTIYGRMESWKKALAEYHQYAKDCRLIVRRKDPFQDPEGTDPNVATLQLNTLKSTRDNVVASILESMPKATLLPETAKLQKQAEDTTDVLDHIMHECDFDDEYKKYVEDYVDVGTGVLQSLWDDDGANGEGEAAVIRWPVEGMLWDPKCSRIQECRAVMKISWHPLSWYKAHYPDDGMFVASDEAANSDLQQNDLDVADLLEGSGDEQQAMLIEYWWREYSHKKHRYTINVAHAAGNALLRVERDVYAHGRYPFAFSAFTPIEGTVVGEGLIGEFVPTMRYINRWNHYMDENFRMASKNRMLVRKNAKVNMDQLTDFSCDVVEGEAIDEMAVRWFQAKPMGSLMPQMQMQLQTDMKQDSGQNQFSRGETAGGVTAMGAIQTLQEAGSKISRYRTKVLVTGFKEIVEQLLWIIAEMYDGPHIRLIVGRSGEPREVDMNAGKLMAPKDGVAQNTGGVIIPPYAVRIEIERKSPSAVQDTNTVIMQMYQMAVQAGLNFPLGLLCQSLTIPDKDRILPLLKKVDEETGKLAQAMQAIEQLQTANDSLKKQLVSAVGRQSAKPAPAPVKQPTAPSAPAPSKPGATPA